MEKLIALDGEVITGQRFSGGGEGVVLATGRPRRESRWIGLKAHYESLDLATDLEIHMGRGAYVGMTRVENGRVNVCGLFRRKQPVTGAESREQMLPRALDEAEMRGAATRLRAARVDAASIKGVNQFFLGWQRRADEGEVRIGDTASIIPPFTGNGMSMAFQSALIAVEPLVDWARGSASWGEYGGAHSRGAAPSLRQPAALVVAASRASPHALQPAALHLGRAKEPRFI